MEKGYINPIGQRVVDVDCGYKIFDAERKDAIILRVGGNYNGQYVYIDRTPVLEKTADVCFMSTSVIMAYETALKIITSTKEYTDEQILEKIIEINIRSGLKGSDVLLAAMESGKDPMTYFEEFLEKYFGKNSEK
ncbi:MAG: hypothetical protein KIH03_06980 [Paludibacteraceae bacterium]|nr:hypothetical protein [Paludibacteraceae bacterium]